MVTIKSQIFFRNGFDIVAANRSEPLPCYGTQAFGTEWIVPIVRRGRLDHYRPGVIQDTKPTPDAIKVIKLEITGTNQTVLIPIPDNGTVGDWVNKCNQCCGTSPTMTVVTPPPVVIEQEPCPTDPGGVLTRTFFDLYPDNPNSLNIGMIGSFNGSFPGVQPPSAGFATPALALAWAQANWAAYGTWTNQNAATKLQLVSTTTLTAGFSLFLVPEIYCLEIAAYNGDEVNQIVISGQTIDIDQLTIETANPQALYFAIADLLPGLQFLQDSNNANAPYIQYTGLQVPVKLMLDGVDVAVFTSGVCF